MGTRNLTVVFCDGEYRVAQYGQFDGYPSGQGIEILRFLKKCNLDKLKEKVILTKTFSQKEIENIIEDNKKKWPSIPLEFNRETAGEILSIIYESENGIGVRSDLQFASKSLFCEWCYVVDLDNNLFEVYRGFNTSPLKESDRFFFLMESIEGDGYYPVKILETFDLKNLPSDDEFLSKLDHDV